ncbi:MAG: ABC transporter permease, partial [Chromatiales bacterium]|nr:ABC transporter permease [Chromatiales bacterium]
QPQEVEALGNYLAEQALNNGSLYPMLRARLTQINGNGISPNDYSDPRSRRLVNREFNLSWAAEMQNHNALLQGEWWSEEQRQAQLFSVEEGIAQTLGISLGDQLSFNLAGVTIEGKVSNLRQVHWDSFQPNFFIIGTPGMLQSYPSTYITSFYLPNGGEKKLANLVKQFPSVTLIDVSSLMNQVREIIARGTMAVEYVFVFTLIAGLLVLYAGIQASRDIRRQESAILRTLGVQRERLLKSVTVEFVILGLLAGLLASFCATITGWGISTELFGLDYQLNPWIWIVGTVGGAVGIGIAGIIATYPLVVHPPLHTLRAE